MDFQIRIAKEALADFEGILKYSWTNFPGEAEQFGDAILTHLEILKTFPFIGNPVARQPGVRQLVHTPIIIYYRVDEQSRSVQVLHFWHGARQKIPAREKTPKR